MNMSLYHERKSTRRGEPGQTDLKFVNIPLDVIRVTEIVSLLLLLDIVENDDGGYEVNHFSGRQQIQIRATVASSVAIPV